MFRLNIKEIILLLLSQASIITRAANQEHTAKKWSLFKYIFYYDIYILLGKSSQQLKRKVVFHMSLYYNNSTINSWKFWANIMVTWRVWTSG